MARGSAALGFNRLVYSSHLGDGGEATVLANFIDQTGPDGLAEIGLFAPSHLFFV